MDLQRRVVEDRLGGLGGVCEEVERPLVPWCGGSGYIYIYIYIYIYMCVYIYVYMCVCVCVCVRVCV